MHGLGKCLGVLAVIGGFVSVYFSARALQVRNEWLNVVETQRQAYEDTIEPLKVAKREFLEVEGDYRRASFGWTPFKSDLTVAPVGNGEIAVNDLGTTDRWIKQNAVIHAYAPHNGEMIYVGPFQVTLAEQGRIGAKPIWPQRGLFPDNSATKAASLLTLQTDLGLQTLQQEFQFGGGWRFRADNLVSPRLNAEGIPSDPKDPGQLAQFEPRYDVVHISQLLTYKDELYLSTVKYKETAENSKASSIKALELRQKELTGDADLVGQTLPKHMIVGVVQAIEDADQDRNEVLVGVADLRHKLKQMNDEVVRLRTENGQLIRSLPGAVTASPATTALSN